jgi:predicted transcriptional regulator
VARSGSPDHRPLIRRIERVERARVAWQQERRAAFIAARDAGMSTRQIGAAAGLSHTQVQNILRGEQS